MVRILMGGLLTPVLKTTTTTTASKVLSISPPTSAEVPEILQHDPTALPEVPDYQDSSEGEPEAGRKCEEEGDGPELLLAIETRRDERETDDPCYCVFLVKQFGGHNKNEANIKISDDPFGDLKTQNMGSTISSTAGAAYSGGDAAASTSSWSIAKASKSRWQIEGIVCPFRNKDDCDEFRTKWMRSSRGLASRRDHGVSLVEEYRRAHGGCELYFFDKRLVPLDPNEYLRGVELQHLAINEHRFRAFLQALALHLSRSI
jgi:hypothetical protein